MVSSEHSLLRKIAMSATFVRHFAALKDPRVERTRRHPLLSLLVIALCAVVCGAEGWEDMEAFAKAKEDWLRERLGLALPHGIPHHDTFRRVFARLDPEHFRQCFIAWTAALQEQTQGQVVACDGKALRHSFDTALGQEAIHMVSAWAAASRLVLGQLKVDAKTNEIDRSLLAQVKRSSSREALLHLERHRVHHGQGWENYQPGNQARPRRKR